MLYSLKIRKSTSHLSKNLQIDCCDWTDDNASQNLLGGYHGSAPFIVTPLQAMRETWGAEKRHTRWAATFGSLFLESSIDSAVEVASQSDLVLLGKFSFRFTSTESILIIHHIHTGLGLCANNYGGQDPVCPSSRVGGNGSLDTSSSILNFNCFAK